MKKTAAIIPLALLAWVLTIEHPTTEIPAHSGDAQSMQTSHAPAAIFATSLADSMPPGWTQALGLDNVHGFRISSVSGHTASYFEYQTDHRKLLSALSLLPFHKMHNAADTTARKIAIWEVLAFRNQLSPDELEKSRNFWSAAGSGVEAYQCLKPPFLHTILINPTTKQVFHRMEAV